MTMTAAFIKNKKKSCLVLFAFWATAFNTFAGEGAGSSVEGGIIDAITAGKLDLLMNLRYENVDDDTAIDEANALTLRTVLGYKTGEFGGFFARAALQDVRELVNDYNDGTGRSAARARYAVVADPAETDFLEAYVGFTGLNKTTIKAGRQIITYRDAPLHRFIGTVGWRQNWQNHDAVTLVNTSIENLKLSYAYSWNINRIFTDEAVLSARANFEGDSHLFNAQYTGFSLGKLETYGYLLDFDNVPASSTATYGVRFSGDYSISEGVKLIYAAEYAAQDDYGNNPASVDDDYFNGEIGVNFKVNETVDSVTLKFDYEYFSGDGTTSFATPLATLHPFQGWGDKFLATPTDGIDDFYFSADVSVYGFKFTAIYHDFSSDNLDYDYGTEINLQATRALTKHLTFGIKYADYDGDSNALNLVRNPSLTQDVTKFWTWVQFKY